jgi:hypothetical protein
VFSAEPLGKIRQKSYTVGLMKPRQDATPPPEITFLTQDEVRRLFAVITGKRDRAEWRFLKAEELIKFVVRETNASLVGS